MAFFSCSSALFIAQIGGSLRKTHTLDPLHISLILVALTRPVLKKLLSRWLLIFCYTVSGNCLTAYSMIGLVYDPHFCPYFLSGLCRDLCLCLAHGFCHDLVHGQVDDLVHGHVHDLDLGFGLDHGNDLGSLSVLYLYLCPCLLN